MSLEVLYNAFLANGLLIHFDYIIAYSCKSGGDDCKFYDIR